MTTEDIKRLIETGESRTLELKKTTGELKDAMHTACAFLNTEGGWLVFGVTPQSLKILGQHVTDDTQREIALALNHIYPAVDVRVEYIDVPEHPDNKVIALHFDGWVWGNEPYTYHGCPYYKVESTTKEMPRTMYDERLKAAQPHKFGWEKQFAEGFAEKDIDENRLRAAIRLGVESGRIAPTANGESIDSLLGKLKLKKDGQPTNAAVMLFAKDTSDYPQLLLRMARFMGTDKNEFFDNQRQQGNFFDLLDAGMQFAYKHLNISGKIVGVHRIDKLEIPIEALREALINALCHRTYDNPGTSVSLAIYDDRVEIVNPGRLPNELTVETMMQPHESHPMNPDIANVLFKTTYLENWGSGVNRIVTACKSANAPTPFYELRPGGLAIVFPRPKDSDVGNNVGENVGNNQEVADKVADKVANKVANKSAQNVLVLLYNNGHLTREQLCAKTGLSLGGIKKILNSLREKGLIERVGGNKTGYWKVHI